MPRRAPLVVFAACLLSPQAARAQDAYVPNQGTDDLKIFDVLNPSDTVTLGTGNQPHEGVATLDARYVFVSNRLDHNLSVYDAITRTEIDTDGNPDNGTTRIAVGNQPHGLAVTPDNRYLFVANDGSNDVTVIDLVGLQLISTVPGVGSAPHMVAIRPDGAEAWVGNVAGGDVALIDVHLAVNDPTNAVICVTPGGAGAQCRIPAGSGTEGIVFSRDGATAYAANGGADTVTVIDVATRTVIHTLGVPGSPRRVHVRPDGLRAYVSQLFGNAVSVIDTATQQLLPGELIPDLANTLGLEFLEDGTRLYVANFFSSEITAVHFPDTDVRETIGTGANPDSVVILPEKVFGLRFGGTTLRWQRNFLADSYNVYRGPISSLPDYGTCQNADDPNLQDTVFVDTELPPSGEAFFYLVSIRHDGNDGILGYATDGTLRVPRLPCS
jgi:YVTN family beta-propeller protein